MRSAELPADLATITKMDLAEVVGFDRSAMLSNIASVRPGLPVLEISARTGVGLAAFIDHLRQARIEALSLATPSA